MIGRRTSMKMQPRRSHGLTRRLASCPISVAVLLLALPADSAVSAPPRARAVQGAPLYEVLAPDAIPAIDAPTFATAEEARGFMSEDEPVLGVTNGRVAKCYSTWQLERHEIVNDWLGDLPIAAEW